MAEVNGACAGPSVSDDGSRVAFSSVATNLVAGDTNGQRDVFVRDRGAGRTWRVSVDDSGAEADRACFQPQISADGRFVVFVSRAAGLVAGDANDRADVFLHEIATGTTERVSVDLSGGDASGDSGRPSVSADGRYVAFESAADDLVASDGNGTSDVFVRDRVAGTTVRASVASDGSEADGVSREPSISRDGRFVAFTSGAKSLEPGLVGIGVFVRDLVAGTTRLASISTTGAVANGPCWLPAVSDDGERVTFLGVSTNLVPGQASGASDVFVHDFSSGATWAANVDEDGDIPRATEVGCFHTSISGDGRFVVFQSYLFGLIPDDSFFGDVLCRNEELRFTSRMDLPFDGSQPLGHGNQVATNVDGRFVAFVSNATNLVPQGTPNSEQIFLRERRLDAASVADYGTGHPGTLGIPTLTAGSEPIVTSDLSIAIDGSAPIWSYALLLIGTQRVQWPTSFGGDLLVDPIATLPIALPPGGFDLRGAIPRDERLVGLEIDLQLLQADAGASAGVAFSAGLALAIGY